MQTALVFLVKWQRQAACLSCLLCPVSCWAVLSPGAGGSGEKEGVEKDSCVFSKAFLASDSSHKVSV
jgi:hypothetical protein